MPWRRPTATTTARNYGNPHQKARTAAAAKHRPSDPCARCGHPLGPMGPWLHLDHSDDRTRYLGFSHGDHPCMVCGHRCNRRAGAIKAGKVWAAQKQGRYVAPPPMPRPPKAARKVKAPKPEPVPRYCAMCGAPVPKDRRTLCSKACDVERNAKAARERYRERNGLPPTWELPVETAARW